MSFPGDSIGICLRPSSQHKVPKHRDRKFVWQNYLHTFRLNSRRISYIILALVLVLLLYVPLFFWMLALSANFFPVALFAASDLEVAYCTVWTEHYCPSSGILILGRLFLKQLGSTISHPRRSGPPESRRVGNVLN